MKRLVLILTVLAIFCSCCQNVLTYKNRKYYSEDNTIKVEGYNVFKLCQESNYHKPYVIDGGFSRRLYLTFLDIDAAKTKNNLNLETDTLIVQAKYDFWSIWVWNYEDNKPKGTIKILQWDEYKIVLKENIVVKDIRGKIKRYSGKRTFYHKKNLPQTQTINVNKKHDLKNLNLNFCDTFSVEITGLYPILDTLPNALEERTFVKSLLTKNGFIQTDWGRGNWENGPRFFYWEYRKDNCICKVFKKYYYNRIQRDSTYNLRVTERIICNSDMFMDE